MKKNDFVIPLITLLLITVIFLNISVIREIAAFAYLSFIPGFVLLKAFKLKELNTLNTFLFSVGLSLFVSMFIGLGVNELYLFLGFSQPLTVIPLTVAISIFTLTIFLINYERDYSINFASMKQILKASSNLPLMIVPVILPIVSIFGALYINIPLMTILFLTIVALCILSVVSKKHVPNNAYPLLIFSVALSVLLLNLLMSKYIIGWDSIPNITFSRLLKSEATGVQSVP